MLTECALPKIVEQFNNGRKKIFIARVCFDDIQKIKAIQKQNTTIAKIQSGSKTAKSKFIRKKPKVIKPKITCNGSCCKNYTDHKVKTVELISTNYEAISSFIYDYVVGDEGPEKVTKKSTDKYVKYVFDMCKNDKHILKGNEYVNNLKRIRDKEYYKCKRNCGAS